MLERLTNKLEYVIHNGFYDKSKYFFVGRRAFYLICKRTKTSPNMLVHIMRQHDDNFWNMLSKEFQADLIKVTNYDYIFWEGGWIYKN